MTNGLVMMWSFVRAAHPGTRLCWVRLSHSQASSKQNDNANYHYHDFHCHPHPAPTTTSENWLQHLWAGAGPGVLCLSSHLNLRGRHESAASAEEEVTAHEFHSWGNLPEPVSGQAGVWARRPDAEAHHLIPCGEMTGLEDISQACFTLS